jgi:hypothetical protein
VVPQPSARTVATLVAALVVLGAVLSWALAQVHQPPDPEPRPFGLVPAVSAAP